MKRFYCNGKQGFCDEAECPSECEFYNNEGDGYIDDAGLRPPEKNKLKVVLDEGAIMPTRAHKLDAGYDLYAPHDVYVESGRVCGNAYSGVVRGSSYMGCAIIDTGVHVAIPEGYVGFIKSKSGLNVNHGLTGEGVIDAGYTGSICVKLYNHTDKPYHFKRKQKIAQLVILPIITPELELVEALEDTERGTGGFGSTGKF